MFYNVPARLKFLKRDSTERQQIENFISRYAIAYPLIRFLLVVDGKNVFQTNGKGNQREIVAQLYGIDLARQMLEVNLERG
jgi:DNA mismatch repair protein MutL